MCHLCPILDNTAYIPLVKKLRSKVVLITLFSIYIPPPPFSLCGLSPLLTYVCIYSEINMVFARYPAPILIEDPLSD